MSKQTLAVKYRPKSFEDVTEQGYIISILKQQIKSNEPVNCYLLVGPAGTGKTTTARILANELNEHQGVPIELDAASNNGVDDIRDVIDGARKKSLDSKYKVYILDEVHMLTTQAWNAMLKLLEEPPKYTIFILCTTDPQKIPSTILSRVMRFDFQKISNSGITKRLEMILTEEFGKQHEYSKEAVEFIAEVSNGGMRDSISNMEKCLDLDKNFTLESVQDALGFVKDKDIREIYESILQDKQEIYLKKIEELFYSGVDMKILARQILDFSFKVYFNELKDSGKVDNSTHKRKIIAQLLELDRDIKYHNNPRLFIESFLVTLCCR